MAQMNTFNAVFLSNPFVLPVAILNNNEKLTPPRNIKTIKTIFTYDDSKACMPELAVEKPPVDIVDNP